MPTKRPRYENDEDENAPYNDPSLTLAQRGKHGFRRNIPIGADFRFGSNPTKGGYSSGYHEAVITTDAYSYLTHATDNLDGTHSLPNAGPKSYFKNFNGQKVYSSTLKTALKLADGFRSDTAQTILSAPDGKAAGHTGSQINTTGQSYAHNLLRQKVLDILQLDPKKTKGISEKSLACLFGSVSVTSMAPGELARTVTGNTATLKAGNMKQNWESNRNEAKRRVEELRAGLNSDEQDFVDKHAVNFMKSTLLSTVPAARKIPSLRATSPERSTSVAIANEVAGGSYLAPVVGTKLPSKLHPSTFTAYGTYITEPFREDRW